MVEATVVLTPQTAGLALPVRTRGKRERRLVAVASAAVLLGGTASMAAAAQNALPGEALYPLKRGIENVEAGLSVSSAGRGRDLLHQADARLAEAQGLVDRGAVDGGPQVTHTIEAFTSQAQQGADLLVASYADTDDPRSIAAVRTFAGDALARIEALNRTAPPEAQPGLREAALALRDIDARARQACTTCIDRPLLSLPSTFVTGAEVNRAMQRFASLQPDNSHPVVAAKQDLKRADTAAGGARSAAGSPGTGNAAGSSAGSAAGDTVEKAAGSVTGAVPKAVPTAAAGLPRVPRPTAKGKADLGGEVSSVTRDLGDAVTTLLPDPVKGVTGGLSGVTDKVTDRVTGGVNGVTGGVTGSTGVTGVTGDLLP
jgi:hypothetical protein